MSGYLGPLRLRRAVLTFLSLSVDTGIRLREDGSWSVDGQTDLNELAEALGEEFGEHDGFHTVAGLVLHHLSRLPDEGEILQLGRFEVEVIDMDDRRIDKLLFRTILNKAPVQDEN